MSDDDVLVPDGPHYAMPPLSPESDGEVAAEDRDFSVRCWEMVSRRLDQNSRQISGPLVSRLCLILIACFFMTGCGKVYESQARDEAIWEFQHLCDKEGFPQKEFVGPAVEGRGGGAVYSYQWRGNKVLRSTTGEPVYGIEADILPNGDTFSFIVDSPARLWRGSAEAVPPYEVLGRKQQLINLATGMAGPVWVIAFLTVIGSLFHSLWHLTGALFASRDGASDVHRWKFRRGLLIFGSAGLIFAFALVLDFSLGGLNIH